MRPRALQMTRPIFPNASVPGVRGSDREQNGGYVDRGVVHKVYPMPG